MEEGDLLHFFSLIYWNQPIHLAHLDTAFHAGTALDVVLVWLVEIGRMTGHRITIEMEKFKKEATSILVEQFKYNDYEIKKFGERIDKRRDIFLKFISNLNCWLPRLSIFSAAVGLFLLIFIGLFSYEIEAPRWIGGLLVVLVVLPMPGNVSVHLIFGRIQLWRVQRENSISRKMLNDMCMQEDRDMKDMSGKIDTVKKGSESPPDLSE